MYKWIVTQDGNEHFKFRNSRANISMIIAEHFGHDKTGVIYIGQVTEPNGSSYVCYLISEDEINGITVGDEKAWGVEDGQDVVFTVINIVNVASGVAREVNRLELEGSKPVFYYVE